MIRANLVRLYPTHEQAIRLTGMAASCRWLWNHFLARNIAQYEENKTFIFHKDMSKSLPNLKKEHPWLKATQAHALQQVTDYLDRAIKDACKKKKGFPRFKKKSSSSDSFYVANTRIKVLSKSIHLSMIGKVKARGLRHLDGRILSATIRQDGLIWSCSIVYDIPDHVLPCGNGVIGIDLGLLNYLTTSDGEVVDNPRHLRKSEKQLKRLSRQHSKKTKGSSNRRKTQECLRRLHRRVRNQRKDFLHKTTSDLIAKNRIICLEDLSIKGLARTRLAKSVHDASWGEFIRQLSYKAEASGTEIIKIDRFFPSSQLCSACGERQKLTLGMRRYICGCGLDMDRDANAARNILKEGLRQIGRGTSEFTPVEIPLSGTGFRLSRYGSVKQEYGADAVAFAP